MEHAQRVAARTVRRVLAGTTLPVALAAARNAPDDDRALIQELSYGTLRFLGQLRAVVRMLADRPLTDASVEALLWIALYQLIHTDAPPHAVVHGAVQATERLKKSSARGLTNAILRNFLRRRDALLAAIAGDDEARFSYPRWWIDRVRAEYGARAEAILDHGNARPPLTLRVNLRTMSRDRYLEELAGQGIAATAQGDAGVVVTQPRAVAGLPGYAEGAFLVQDAGAQLAGPLLGIADGMRVLDACAAPGGKTAHLLELADVDVVALDSDPARLVRVRDNLARLKLDSRHVEAVAGDAGAPAGWWDGRPFERVLADVPCTASGVVRRHPDGKWLRRPGDIASFARQQARLLDALWPCVAPDGMLLYATCSIFRDENEGQIEAFLGRHANALREPLTFPPDVAHRGAQLLPSLPGAAHNQDGFFYALLRRG
jgi:16S rRNA (cytosine967-C5)-methyltransferase